MGGIFLEQQQYVVILNLFQDLCSLRSLDPETSSG